MNTVLDLNEFKLFKKFNNSRERNKRRVDHYTLGSDITKEAANRLKGRNHRVLVGITVEQIKRGVIEVC